MKAIPTWGYVLGVAALAVVAALVLHSGRIQPGEDDRERMRIPTQGPLTLNEVRSWAYQLQDVEAPGAVDALAASRYDLIIVDPVRTESEPDARNFNTAAAVARLKNSAAQDGVHRKLVLAAINIGEAESWRWYWTWGKDRKTPRPADWPSFILNPDPEAAGGDFPVAFWEKAWKAIVLGGTNGHPGTGFESMLDEALRDGFDGVYLDWVEAFGDERVAEAATKAGIDPVLEMSRFLGEIRQYVRGRNPGFLILQANAADLIAEQPESANAVDGIVQESIWFTGATDADWPDPLGYDQRVEVMETMQIVTDLKAYRAAGKPIFDLEYAVEKAPEAYRLSRKNGFIPYCTRAALNQLSSTPPPE